MTNRVLNRNLPALLTVDQAAEQLGVSRARLYQLIGGDNPAISSVRVGRLRRIAATDLEDYLLSLRPSRG
jgi:excisionase family DNA binding protein